MTLPIWLITVLFLLPWVAFAAYAVARRKNDINTSLLAVAESAREEMITLASSTSQYARETTQGIAAGLVQQQSTNAELCRALMLVVRGDDSGLASLERVAHSAVTGLRSAGIEPTMEAGTTIASGLSTSAVASSTTPPQADPSAIDDNGRSILSVLGIPADAAAAVPGPDETPQDIGHGQPPGKEDFRDAGP